MKRLLLIILLGLFLISFVSATINVYANTTRPVFNIKLIVSNGTASTELFDNTNYYFQCFIGGYGYNGENMAPASEEFNITTNSTHKWINISNFKTMCASYPMSTGYKGVHCRFSMNRSFKDWGGEGYLPASFNNNESLSGVYWIARYGNPGGYYNSELRCSGAVDYSNITNDTLNHGDNGNYEKHTEIAIPLSYRNNLSAGGFNVTQGMLEININTTGTQTWTDLINALNSSGYSGLYSNTMYGGLAFIGIITGTGSLNLSTKTLTQIMSYNANPNLIFEKGSQHYLETIGGNYYWLTSTGKYYDSSVTVIPVNTWVIDDMVPYLSNVFITTNVLTNYEGYNKLIFNPLTTSSHHFSSYWVDGYAYSANNSIWNGLYDYVVPTGGEVQNTTSYFINDTFNNYGKTTYGGNNADIVAYPGNIAACGNYTRNYNMINTVSNRPNKRLIIYYNSRPALNLWCNSWMNFTFYGDLDFTVIQTNGTTINDSNVTLSNSYGTYTGQTNSNGYIKLVPMFYRIYYNFSQTVAPYLYASILEAGIYNLTITKNGFVDYNAVVNLTESMKMVIALESQPDWNYSWIPEFKILNNSKHTIFKITDDGNLAIAGKLYENTNSPPPTANIVWKFFDFMWLDDLGNLYIKGVIYLSNLI